MDAGTSRSLELSANKELISDSESEIEAITQLLLVKAQMAVAKFKIFAKLFENLTGPTIPLR